MKIRYFAHKQRITGTTAIKINLPNDALFITGYNLEARTDQTTAYNENLGTVNLLFNGNIRIDDVVEREERTLNDDYIAGASEPEFLTNDIQGQSACFCDVYIPVCLKEIVGLATPRKDTDYYDLTISFQYQAKD